MVLSYIWVAFFLIAFVVASIKLMQGDMMVFKTIMDGVFETAKSSVSLSLGLVGAMCLFLGFMSIGERAGAIRFFSRIVGPFFSRLFPELPKNHPAMGHMMMNYSANLLGLDNAATPFGLKAMKSLHELNPDKDTASNSEIMFLVLHASGLTLIPVGVIAQRVTSGSKNPTEIFIPCLICTFIATMVAMSIVAFWQRFKWQQWKMIVIVALIGAAILATVTTYMRHLDNHSASMFADVLSNGFIMLFFVIIILGGLWKRVAIFDAFIDGAKEGFEVAVKIIPYLVGLLVAISVLRSCGVFDYVIDGAKWLFGSMGLNTDFVPALPTALMRPLSGSGSRAMMISVMDTTGADSFPARLSAMFQGASETTFYVVALYFGSVGIKKTRYAIPACLLADLASVITAILLAYNWPWSS